MRKRIKKKKQKQRINDFLSNTERMKIFFNKVYEKYLKRSELDE